MDALYRQWLSQPDQHLLILGRDPYPALLRQIADPPRILFAKGNLALLQQPAIAMVGSRKPSLSGLRQARSFARQFAALGWAIVSGLAMGIDAACHRGALDVGGSTIAVLGCGCDINYPASNSALTGEIWETGLVLSEYPPGTPPLPGNFPKRNRIITGLAQGTLIVEARLKSGSLISAQTALDQNREVFAIPGPVQYGQYGGCHELIRSGAVLTETIADVLAEITLIGEVEASPSPSPSPRASAESGLLALIDDQPLPYSSLLNATGLTMQDLSGQLSQLELAGLIVNSVEGYHRA